ncbi:MAG: glycosyltransferase family 4 protein [Candidatus Promineifilaceae bacterium]
MRKFRLAHVISHPIQYRVPLYRALSRDPRVDLTVFYCSRRGMDAYLDRGFGQEVKWDVPLTDGYTHKFLPNVMGATPDTGLLNDVNPSIVQELRRGKFDAVWVSGHNSLTNLMAIATAKLTRTRVFMRCETHLGLERRGFKKRVRHVVMSNFYRLIDAGLPIGTLNAAFYRAHGVSAEKLSLVPYAVDNQFFMERVQQIDPAQAKLSLGFSASKPLILFASKLIGRKRPLDLLKAFHQLQQRGVAAELVYVGSGELEAELKQYVVAHDVQDVIFSGFQNQTKLPMFYAAADLFAFPTENEPWGLVLNEVMCAGLPIVASAEIGAIPDLVRHGENGLLFEAGDVATLSTHLETLVTQPALRAEMGANSLERIQTWSFAECIEGIVAALESTSSHKIATPLPNTSNQTA